MLYYTLKNGRVTTEFDMQKAFEICTGSSSAEHVRNYSKWLFSLLGKTIIKTTPEMEMTYEELIRGGNNVQAVRLYRERNHCTLIEARDAIETMKADILNKKTDGKDV